MSYSNPDCWAAALGGCSEKISREHYVTKGLFDDKKIVVTNLKWCRNEDRTIGVESLTAKFLCKHHNEMLSELDLAGIAFKKTWKNIDEIDNIRKMRGFSFVRQHVLDGKLLERWFLKTLINLSLLEGHKIACIEATESDPPVAKELLEILFSGDEFQPRAGLYSLAKVDMFTGGRTRMLTFGPLLKGNTAVGGVFHFCGHHFALFLPNNGLDKSLEHMTIGKTVLTPDNFIYRVSAINITMNNQLNQQLIFKGF